MNHWGRIFFDDPMNPKIIKAQPLENHINNCCRILEKFDKSCFISESLSTQMQEVMIHDEIKTDIFCCPYPVEEKAEKQNGLKKGKKNQSNLSGFQLRTQESDPDVKILDRDHYEFPVKQTRAHDLLLLCMADKIETELVIKTIENQHGLPHTFMAFSTQKISSQPTVFTITPWPFSQREIFLIFCIKVFCLEDTMKKDLLNIEMLIRDEMTVFSDEMIVVTLRSSNDK